VIGVVSGAAFVLIDVPLRYVDSAVLPVRDEIKNPAPSATVPAERVDVLSAKT
jgi:hypothetical protein